jgi:hypothetical protein
VNKTYIVTFTRSKDRRPAKFVVIANNQREAIRMAWEHGEDDFHETYDRASGQAQEMKRVMRVF